MSYGNWKQVLGVFKLWKLSYDGNLVNTHTLRDPPTATFDITLLFSFSFFHLVSHLVWMPTTPSLITHHWKYLNFLKWHVWYLFPTPDNSKIQIFVWPTHHFCGVKWSCKFNTWKSRWCEVRSFVVWSDHVSSTHEGTVGVKSEVAAGPEKCPDRGSLNVCVFTRMPP